MGVIELVVEDVRTRCFDALASVGASRAQCQFYSDAIKCEYETMYITYQLLAELRDSNTKQPAAQSGSSRSVGTGPGTGSSIHPRVGDVAGLLDVAHLCSTVLKITKNFVRWKAELDGLATRRVSIPPLRGVDVKNRTKNELLTALCTLQTPKMDLLEGDELTIVDSSQPNKLKVRNSKGEEGYIPALSCIVPTPDNNSLNTVERLQIHLLACWTDAEAKVRPLVQRAIGQSSDQLAKQWASCPASRRFASHDVTSWEAKVTRRLKRITDVAHNDPSAIDLNRLRKTFCSLENELLRQGSPQLLPMIDTVVDLDKAILSYQAFRKHWRQFRAGLRGSTPPINIIAKWNPKAFSDLTKPVSYYEVKLTAAEITTNEETTFLSPSSRRHDDDEMTSSSGATHVESVAAEQLTSASHEENRRFVIRSVVDPRDGAEISMGAAVAGGIIDHREGVYRNPRTGETRSIARAMNEGLIRVEYAETTRTAEKIEAVGLISIKSQVDDREYTITGVVDSTTRQQMTVDEARDAGVLDDVAGIYVDSRTGLHIALDDAIDAGWVMVEFDGEPSGTFETKTYAVSAVLDQAGRPVSFIDAVRCGLVDRDTGNYVNGATGERVYAADAIRRGLYKSKVVDDAATGLDVNSTNRVVVERIDRVRRHVLRGVKVT